MALLSAEVGEEVFLQGQFINVGVNSNGSLGTANVAPTGFFTDTANGFGNLGLFADTDGFGVGSTPTFRDTTLPGIPVEGFSVGYTSEGTLYVLTNKERTGITQITGGDGENISTGSAARASWVGTTAEDLRITQIMSVLDGENYIRVDITLTNTGDNGLTGVRYMRNVDPDQAPGFTTDNQIILQGEDGALVASYVPGGTFPFFYYSADDRAVVSNYGFQNSDPYFALAYDTPQPAGFTEAGDTGVNITFALGDLAAGASVNFTFYMGVTDDLDDVVNSIVPDLETNVAPSAEDDAFTGAVDADVMGNVLANDTDGDIDPLTATLVSGPSSGGLLFAPDGSFTYTPLPGFTGTATFTYSASDGEESDTATVTITVEGDGGGGTLPDCPTVDRPGTQDGSASGNQTLTGPGYHNTFYFDVGAASGKDTITNFAKDDILVTNERLADGNGDGFITFGSNGVLDLDGADAGTDTVTITGMAGSSGLRYLGESCPDVFVYADASVRPRGSRESTVADDTLTGDASDRRSQVFFFDTALDIDLGSDRINNFGRSDVLVTTTALFDSDGDDRIDFGDNGLLDLSGGLGGPLDPGEPGEVGQVAIRSTSGASVRSLEFDGSISENGVTYYVYSLTGTPGAGLDTLPFG